jgi:tRNA(Met) C34 N-acetyltransferase TmcA
MESSNIETYYKNIDKPVIDNCVNKLNLKNLLALSTITDLYLFTKKKKNEWKLKDKRELLKECDVKRKKTIKEVSTSLNVLSKNKSTNLVKEIKIKNDTLLNKIENIDSLIETIEKNYPTMSDEYIEIYSN